MTKVYVLLDTDDLPTVEDWVRHTDLNGVDWKWEIVSND